MYLGSSASRVSARHITEYSIHIIIQMWSAGSTEHGVFLGQIK